MDDLPPPPEPPPPKRCPVCNRRIHAPAHAYCSMRCSDSAKADTRAVVAREVAVLMRQYQAGKWLPVDLAPPAGRKKCEGRSHEIPE